MGFRRKPRRCNLNGSVPFQISRKGKKMTYPRRDKQAWQNPHSSVNLKGADGMALVGRSRALSGNIKWVNRFLEGSPVYIDYFTTKDSSAHD
jgi:hypothetical protein